MNLKYLGSVVCNSISVAWEKKEKTVQGRKVVGFLGSMKGGM